MRGKQIKIEKEKMAKDMEFYNQINNVFAPSKRYEVEWINPDAVCITDCNGFNLVLNKSEVKHVWLQPRLAFILQELREITYHTYKDIITIM